MVLNGKIKFKIQEMLLKNKFSLKIETKPGE